MVHCINCGTEVEAGTSVCSECGYPLASEAYEEATEDPTSVPQKKEPRRGRSPLFWVMIAVVVIACIVASVGAVAGFGVYQGLQQRSELNQKAAEDHYGQGLIYMGERNYSLAAAEFEMALQYDPDHPYASDRLAEARALARAEGGFPTPTVDSDQANPQVYTLHDEGEKAYSEGRWEEAADKLEQLRSLAPSYETDKVESLLFSAHYNAGLQLVNDDRMEEALRRFDAALGIDPDNADALGQKRLVTLYLSGTGYVGVDWEKAIDSFSEIYDINPDYKDTEQQLHDAYVGHGDLLMDRGDPCDAAKAYILALEVLSDPAVSSKSEKADSSCEGEEDTEDVESPSPTATAEDTPTSEEEPEEPTVTPTAPSASPSGQIAFPVFDPESSTFEVQMANVDGSNRRTVVTGAHHPSFSSDGTRLVVKSVQQNYLGLRIINVDGSDFVGVTDHAEDGLPVWSNDGAQLAFSSNRHGDRRWRVYTMEAYGEDEDHSIAEGTSPYWSPDGFRIAYKGCDPTGALCGIFVTDSGGVNKERLTTDPDDTAPAWSPAGDKIAFMSDRDGNWEIYVINVDGSGLLRLTDNASDDGLPAWSPDGNFIAYMSNRGGSWALHAIRPDGADDQKLFDLGGILGGDWMNDRISWSR
jgi:tetratricopeptide (TPR) repeat protein